MLATFCQSITSIRRKGESHMRFFKFLFSTVIILVLIAFSVYYFAPKIVADQVVSKLSAELENNAQLAEVKEELKHNPEVQKYLQEAAQANEETLPFHTPEQAVRSLATKLNVQEMNELQKKARTGFTAEDQRVWLEKMENRLTEEELLALKVIAYKELMK